MFTWQLLITDFKDYGSGYKILFLFLMHHVDSMDLNWTYFWHSTKVLLRRFFLHMILSVLEYSFGLHFCVNYIYTECNDFPTVVIFVFCLLSRQRLTSAVKQSNHCITIKTMWSVRCILNLIHTESSIKAYTMTIWEST